MMPRRASRRSQRGVTILVVLVLLAVMLLGGLAMARMTETRTLASGNTAFREASLQAAEVGLNEAYALLYVVERLCTVAVLTDTLRECLVRQVPQLESNKVGQEPVDPPNARQFRVTVRVFGPKDTQTWTQALVTRG